MKADLHILLIDDNPDDRVLVRRELDRAISGISFTEISNQDQFDAALNRADFDLVITDYHLRWTNGIHILNEIKRGNPDNPVIMYTGTGSEEIAVSAMRLGLDDYILKGVKRIVRLPAAVKAILKSKKEALRRTEIQLELDRKTIELDSYFDNALDLFCIANTKGYFLRLNREWEHALGYTLQDLEGKRLIDYVHPDDIVATLGALASLIDQKKVLNFINRYRCKDGSYRWIEWRSVPAGNLIYAAARDITDRKHHEESIRLQASALEASASGIMITDNQGTIQWINPATETITGYSRDELIGENPRIFKSDKHDKIFYKNLWDTILAGDTWRGEMENKRKDGSPIIVNDIITPVRDGSGSISHFVGVQVDVTEKRNAELELRKSEERYRSIFYNSTIGIYRTTPTGHIIAANPALVKMLGYGSFEELAQRNLEVEGFGPDYKRLDFIRQMENNGRVTGLEAGWSRVDGTQIYVRESAVAIRDPAGKITYYEGTVEDITQRREAEVRLERQLMELKVLYQVANICANAVDADSMIEKITKIIGKSFYPYNFGILIIEKPTNELVSHSSYHFSTKRKLWNIRLGKGIVGSVGKSGKAILANNVHRHRNYISLDPNTKSELAVPIKIGRNILGVINTESRRLNAFHEEDKQLLLTIASQIATSLERLRSLAELKSSEEKYRQLVETAEEAILVVQDGRIKFANPRASRISGYSESELLDRGFLEFVDADDREELELRYQDRLRGIEFASPVKFRIVTKTGDLKWAESNAAEISWEEQPALLNFVTDITTRVLAEEERRVSDLRFRTLFEDSQDGVFITSKSGKFLDVNDAFLKMIGYSREEIREKNVSDLYDNPDDRDRYLSAMERQGAVKDFGVNLKHRNGAVLNCLLSASSRENEEDQSIHFQGILRDVTEQAKAREALKIALVKAQEGERVKSLFLANISHEIRTPLNSIMGFTELIELATYHLVKEHERDFFNRIRYSSNRLLRTVHEILDISQLESGNYEIVTEPTDLCRLVNDALPEFRQWAIEKDLAFDYQSELDSVILDLDPHGVSQAVCAILDNAVKYTEKGSILVTISKCADRVLFSVKDTGIGIDRKFHKGMFEAFTQESEGYTKRFQGIGLGLALAKRHLDSVKAEISVKSEKNKGTTITVAFPI